MSVKVMALVFEHDMPELKTDKGKTVPDSTCKFVLLALSDHSNDEGEGAYPGVKRICKRTNMSSQTVCNALNALRCNGYTLLSGKSKFDTNNYTINVSKFHPLGFQPLESGVKSGAIPAARIKPLGFNGKEPSENSAAKTPTPPEIKIFREVTSRYPNKINYPDVVSIIQAVSNRIGRDCTAEDLRPFYAAWCGKGFKPVNLAWLSWAESGVIPANGNKPSNNEPQAFDGIRKFLARQGES